MLASSQILQPVRASTIIASFAIAMFINFLPWRDLRLVPDFVALVLVFWCVRQPRLVGLGVAWALGLITDAGNGVLLGSTRSPTRSSRSSASGCRGASCGSGPGCRRCTSARSCWSARRWRCWCG
jgi:hypothetical protein